jgi:hypothetical protein
MMPTKAVDGPSVEEIKAKMKEVGTQKVTPPGVDGLDHLKGDPHNATQGLEWARAVKEQADAEHAIEEAKRQQAVRNLEAAAENFKVPADIEVPDLKPKVEVFVMTRLREGMEFNAWGNTCLIEWVRGNQAGCRILKLDDPHARGEQGPAGWPSSYWDEGAIYTVHRHLNFPEMDLWSFDGDEMKRDTSVLLLLVEEQGITFDLDS